MTKKSESYVNKHARLKQWAKNLTKKQLQELTVTLIEELIEAETVRFWDDSLAPYWEGDGSPLIGGQKCFDNEEI